MDNLKKGEELNQLSRLLFNKASSRWYQAIIIELVAASLGIVVSLCDLGLEWNVFCACVGFFLLVVAYLFKVSFNGLYDAAETMRRQSILTEGLNWPIGRIQFSDWRFKAGTRILKLFKVQERDADYYATKIAPSPKRLLEMTIESAFWTRHLYKKIIPYIIGLLVISILLVICTFTLSSFFELSQTLKLKVVYFIYLFLPIVLSIDVIGWLVKLIKLSSEIKIIECDMERLTEGGEIKVEQVMRLVSEYNCQVVTGFPIPNWFFKVQHNEIAKLWKMNVDAC